MVEPCAVGSLFEERFGVGCAAVMARRRVDGTPELHHWVQRIHM